MLDRAPDTGAYMNEANLFNTHFAHGFYGESYDRLVETKRKYDPNMSLYVKAGIGTEGWEYDLYGGKLCYSE